MQILGHLSSRSAIASRPPVPAHLKALQRRPGNSRRAGSVRAHKVEIEHQGKKVELEVPSGQSILDVALDNGMELPHDCKMGVCMTCPAKLVSGKVDQSGGMISEDVADKGYALMCVAQPQEDCKVVTISEDELLDIQMGN
ncbi:2Fe-2S ferredoxin-type domain-containing protein [Dunaliella salina]|uniref:2Fe-2S ferredoxin-type domain-containing protein n=1 Tax=Dunaliella salina TaxID=3046 RepID=A0ABQ7GZG1_DUNSA|nr:2Fe-2S ferredoxin-type domain-containing protein [Dunaliella salina]|eukprot:KAF5839985.1 2Fe-2S ferredoxin-type domain-containing protein [Dunaliella salina]